MNGYGRGEDNQNKGIGIVTRESIGITLLLFGVLLLVIAVIGKYIFGDIGVSITAFMTGIFGFFIYPLLVSLIYFSLVLVTGKKLIAGKWIARAAAIVCSVFLIVHLATSSRFFGSGYGAYLGGCWSAPAEGLGNATGGGAVFGLIVYPVRFLLSQIGAYVLFSLLLLLSLFFTVKATPLGKNITFKNRPRKEKVDAKQTEQTSGTRKYPAAFSFDDLETPDVKPAQELRAGYAAPKERRTQNATQSENEPQNGYAPQNYATQGTPRNGYAPQDGYVPQNGYASQNGYVPQNGYASQSGYESRATQSEPPKVEPYIPTGRDILYSSDPARNYRDNLIFSRDSVFNSQERKSSIAPRPAENTQTPEPSVYDAPRRSSIAPQEGQSYKAAYEEQAEASRAPMPRKIVEQKPATGSGYALRSEDLNYPQVPSYKAPEVKKEEPRNYYASDVPYEEFSSAPHIDDIPDDIQENVLEERRAPVVPEPEKTPENNSSAARDSLRDSLAEKTTDELLRSAEQPKNFGARETFGRGEDIGARETFGRGEDIGARETFGRGEDIGSRETFGRSEDVGFTGEIGFGGRATDEGRRTPDYNDRSVLGFGENDDIGSDTGRDRLSLRGTDEKLTEESRAAEGLRRRSDADYLDRDEDDLPSVPAEPAFRTEPAVKAEREAPAHEIPNVPAPKPKKHVYRAYKYPSTSLFRNYDDAVKMPPEEIDRNSAIIVDTLAGFRVDAEIIKVTVGPSVTRYDIDIPRNISVRSVIKHDEEIAMRLHARDGVNIYSNSEVGLISIEVPNSIRAVVGIKSVMESEEFRNAKPEALMFAIGKDVEGRNVCGNIPKMTHILVAGSTNSGKSVCLNAMLVSLICKYSPEELRLILIDPKKVEFTVYDGLPHLMINEIIADAQKAVSALNWSIKEMERRYGLFEQKTRAGIAVRNLDEYNASITEDEEKLAKIVIVVDELADLMSVAKKDIEERIQRLTQKARAAGIHLVIATQRPSVDVITGVIKGNLPTRMAFRVIQEVDSRTILDESGAEKLLGNGDMLYKTGGMFNCSRVQGAFLSSEEVQAIVSDIKANNEAYFDPEIADYINKTDSDSASGASDGSSSDENVTQEYIKALAISVKLGTTSISLIQRKCSVGYNHAGKIIEWMELMGYITPFDGKAKARTVLLTKEEFEEKYGRLD